MNCPRVQKLLPLYVGRELSRKKSKKVEYHLARCSCCGREYRVYSELKNRIKSTIHPERPLLSFDGSERQRLIRNLEAIPEQKSPIFWVPIRASHKVLALGLLIVIVLLGGILSFRSVLFKKNIHVGKEIMPVSELITQDKIRLVFDLDEIDVKVIWFFDKNIDLEK
jgi:predicted anti-sigma-YlaC factor YlaD